MSSPAEVERFFAGKRYFLVGCEKIFCWDGRIFLWDGRRFFGGMGEGSLLEGGRVSACQTKVSDVGNPPVCFNIWHSYLNISPSPNLLLYQITDTRPFLQLSISRFFRLGFVFIRSPIRGMVDQDKK